MRSRTLLPIVLIFANVAHSQDATSRRMDDFTASVRELKGKCLVRDNGAEKPRALKPDDKLQAGQELQCQVSAHLKIRFRTSGADKEIKALPPTWYPIPNVPSVAMAPAAPKFGGRSKGDPLLATAEGVPQSTQDNSRRDTQDIVVEASAPKSFDEADEYWKERKKYFLIIAPSKPGGPGTELNFTKIDAAAIGGALTRVGYKRIDILDDKNATRENVLSQLEKIHSLERDALVVIYYSGHAVTDSQGKDLWLQLYGQDKIGEYRGISAGNLLGAARGATYKGELALVLDTCYSGQGTKSSQLSLDEPDNTVVFASSASYQASYTRILPSGSEVSAFTYYFVQGLTTDWHRVDGDGDGILLYTELQAYIGNQLMEQFRDQAIFGLMRPQLLVRSPRSWVAYDAKQAHNFNTEPRKALHLERAVELRDPEKVKDSLPEQLPENAQAYYRALKAIDGEEFDEAEQLLVSAEKEGRVPLAEIYWARAYLNEERGQLGSARDWLERALSVSHGPNTDLMFYTAAMNFTLGNYVRAEELFKQLLDLTRGETKITETTTGSLLMLTMLEVFQGDMAEAEPYLQRLKAIDPKTLEQQEEGLSALIPFVEFISDILQDKKADARKKLEKLRGIIGSQNDELAGALQSMLQMFETVLNATDDDDLEANTDNLVGITPDDLREWNEALTKKDIMGLSFLLFRLQVVASLPDSPESITSVEVEKLLRRTSEFADEYRLPKKKVTFQDDKGVQHEVEVSSPDSEKESLIPRANLLSSVAQIHLARKDLVQAEKFFKNAISLELKTEGGVVLSVTPTITLAGLYQDSGRFAEAESVLGKVLDGLNQVLGDRNLMSYLVQHRLGELYETWGKWVEAERVYRAALRMALPAFGDRSFFADNARENLAKFLAGRERHEEAVQLLEESVYLLQNNGKSTSLFAQESLGHDFLALGQSYYSLARYGEAGAALQKAADFFSKEKARSEILSCLQWQWATAQALKKDNEADGFYNRMVVRGNSEIAKPKPSKTLGSKLHAVASWFRDSREYVKAEQLMRLTLALQEKAYGTNSVEAADVWLNLGYLNAIRNQFGAARTNLDIARTIYVQRTPADPLRLPVALHWLGFASYQRQDFDQARAELEQSINLLKPENKRNTRYLLGKVERSSGRYDRAKSILESVLQEDQHAPNIDSMAIASDLMELTAISRLRGDREEADRWLAQAETTFGSISPSQSLTRWARLAHEKGMAALAKGRVKEAEQLIREAIEKGQKDSEMEMLMWTEFMDDYAKVLRQRGQNEEAKQIEQQARQIRDTLKK